MVLVFPLHVFAGEPRWRGARKSKTTDDKHSPLDGFSMINEPWDCIIESVRQSAMSGRTKILRPRLTRALAF
jgi:hypothetical protein